MLPEGTDSAGGYTVPTQLSSNIVDKPRAASVMNHAGVQAYLTDSDNLTVAKVTGDPAVEKKLKMLLSVAATILSEQCLSRPSWSAFTALHRKILQNTASTLLLLSKMSWRGR